MFIETGRYIVNTTWITYITIAQDSYSVIIHQRATSPLRIEFDTLKEVEAEYNRLKSLLKSPIYRKSDD